MAYTDRYDAAFSILISRYVRNKVHTNIRGKVVAVDYSVPSVDVQPMAYTEMDNGVIDKYPIIYDVPVQLPSGANGKARLTMPIKAGDMVGLSFSERNENDNKDQNTHQLFAGWAVTQIFSDGNAKPIDPENVVLENDKGSVVIKPNGDMSIKNEKVNIEVKADGSVKVSNGPGTLTMESSGQINANGAKITTSGRMITGNGVDLDDFFNRYESHVHGGVERGNGRTDRPN